MVAYTSMVCRNSVNECIAGNAAGYEAGPSSGTNRSQAGTSAGHSQAHSCGHSSHAAPQHAAGDASADEAAAAAAGPSHVPEDADAEALAALDASLQLIVSGGRLPRSDDFQLPDVVPCRGGCREDVYCSAACDEVSGRNFPSYSCKISHGS